MIVKCCGNCKNFQMINAAELYGSCKYMYPVISYSNGHLCADFVANETVKKEKIQNKHEDICKELNKIYKKKNADYGDSFHLSYLDEGMAMPRVRLGDKYRRFCQLTKSGEQNVKDESVRDTLLDLANYAIMTVMEIDRENEAGRSEEKFDGEGGI